MEPVKLQVRAVASFVLGLLPSAFVDRLRRLHRSSRPHSTQRQLYGTMLNVLRHRHIHPGTDTIRIEELDLLLYNDNSIITKRLFYLGQYEGQETFWWKDFCERAHDIVEFGANTGLYTVLGARVPGVTRYTAVEPHPRCAEVLRRNLSINGIANVSVIEAAVVGNGGAAEMELCVPYLDSDLTPTGGSVVLSELSDRLPRERIMVRTVQARAYVENADLIKMDIEGQELSVLQEIQDVLMRRKPTVFLEVLPQNIHLRNYLPTLCETCGYQVYGITDHGLRPLAAGEIAEVDYFRRFGTRDLILTTSRIDNSLP
jgi:FkbM family methyltransferase